MGRLLCFLLLLFCLCCSAAAKDASPKVQVYSRAPREFGKNNTLICHVSGFHPPEISIKLLKNEQELPNSQQTDLAFEESWKYHLTTHVSFTPDPKDKYSCRVTHLQDTKTYDWDADM
ncbi:beta-2-microglobulin-like [Salarias fasciatus]|uniref:Beta-2-microglobulin n=1 Tax=Salarias fasciatus TaxID=181472 RepID=A0A672H5P7_SALFA|nr:beta-2-microglobulin-like [Salarias fasciatus]XP_029969363.1 beta-2-microglobulin-like [Salarias fasciatus]XP_029969365.1 beta-2-microglobulin-like [Salarias fasciatus]XP_029969366.1 beta-2-microglobulin-like [Salarias fasciatus]XP_029969367.1 beta-2-microglobulin-like [Salarias fasciatus]XP_029969368.1 beta-2-microglobulin-like [Salarias fasciatus]